MIGGKKVNGSDQCILLVHNQRYWLDALFEPNLEAVEAKDEPVTTPVRITCTALLGLVFTVGLGPFLAAQATQGCAST
jgi:hypothetical protein